MRARTRACARIPRAARGGTGREGPEFRGFAKPGWVMSRVEHQPVRRFAAALRKPAPVPEPRRDAEDDGHAVRPFRILIVEDQALTALDLEEHLLHLGHYVVDIVDTGPAAVAAAEAHRPDLVFMDIRLAGGSDGVEAAAEIRHRLSIPSIFLTAHSDEATRARTEAVVPIAFLTKPFTAGQIKSALRRAELVLGRDQ